LDWKINDVFVKPKIYIKKDVTHPGISKKHEEMKLYEPIFQFHAHSGNFSMTAFGSNYSTIVKSPIQQQLCPIQKEKRTITVRELQSPMPGTIVSIRAQKGMFLKKDDEICIMEAMKMQNIIKSPQDGFVEKVYVAKGDRVQVDQPLISFTKSSDQYIQSS
jgi:biotin carboxyl carrier protein